MTARNESGCVVFWVPRMFPSASCCGPLLAPPGGRPQTKTVQNELDESRPSSLMTKPAVRGSPSQTLLRELVWFEASDLCLFRQPAISFSVAASQASVHQLYLPTNAREEPIHPQPSSDHNASTPQALSLSVTSCAQRCPSISFAPCLVSNLSKELVPF